MIDKSILTKLYTQDGLSMMEMSKKLGYSPNKIVYWMHKHQIPRRTISDAVYIKKHPSGDPFAIRPIKTIGDAHLHGMGLGLYWGEGTKANKHSIRLGNTDPELIKTFVKFLTELYGVPKDGLKFGLQLFTDVNPESALSFWTTELGVKRSQFYKITVTISGSIGTYRRKSKYGVVTVYYHNKKLRDILIGKVAALAQW